MSLSNLVRVGSVAAVAAGALLLPVALVGLYARQAEAAGALGLVGFLVAFVGTGLLAGMFWTLAFVAPSLAVEAPAVLDTEPTGPLAFGLLFSGIVVGLGWTLFGIAMFRGLSARCAHSSRSRCLAHHRAAARYRLSYRSSPYLAGLLPLDGKGCIGRATRERAVRIAREPTSPR